MNSEPDDNLEEALADNEEYEEYEQDDFESMTTPHVVTNVNP
jgi:hypothetical protein